MTPAATTYSPGDSAVRRRPEAFDEHECINCGNTFLVKNDHPAPSTCGSCAGMVIKTINLPAGMLDAIDVMVAYRICANASEYIRSSVSEKLKLDAVYLETLHRLRTARVHESIDENVYQDAVEHSITKKNIRFQCELCNYSSRQKWRLEKHVKAAHFFKLEEDE